MAVIKQKQAERLTQNAVVLDLGDLKRQGAQLLARSRAEAQRILDDAQQEASRIIESAAEIGEKQGYDEGMKRGLSEGRDQGREEAKHAHAKEIQQLIARWTKAVDAWEAARRDLLLEAREDVIALAIALAERVTHRQIAAQPELIADQIAETLALVGRRSKAVVRIHPDDRAILTDVLEDIVARVDSCAEATIVDDPAIARGGCIVTTDGGHIDASISTQLDRLAETLLPGRTDRLAPGPDNESAADDGAPA